jgi:UDP-N-acetylmuramoyl-tripeptide--D-alanyl-D-alanine ligase
MKLVAIDQVLNLLDLPIDTHVHKHTRISGFSVDTRTLNPGEIYVALKGERVDGHCFLAEAQFKGAIAAIVSKQYQGPDFGLILIRVEDPLHALQEMTKKILACRQVRIIAVTGSIGKTTTKEFIKVLLSKKYRVCASPGNSNSQVGLPLTVLNHTTGEEEILILEMGMTAQNHLCRLVQIAPPELALITNVSLVHACNFNAIEEIAYAKAEIFCHPQTRLGLLSRDITNYEEIIHIGSCRKISFSTSLREADYYLDPVNPNFIHARLEGRMISLENLVLPGRHNLHNLLASTVVARHFNISWEEINQAISVLQLPERRLQYTKYKDILFINDSYNAAELSVKAALEILPNPEGQGNKIAVLGSMMELGKFSDDCHQRVGEFALNHVDRMYCLGQECHPIYKTWKAAGKPVELFLDRARLVEALRAALKPSDVVLLKGSRSKELWKVLEEL